MAVPCSPGWCNWLVIRREVCYLPERCAHPLGRCAREGERSAYPRVSAALLCRAQRCTRVKHCARHRSAALTLC